MHRIQPSSAHRVTFRQHQRGEEDFVKMADTRQLDYEAYKAETKVIPLIFPIPFLYYAYRSCIHT